MSRFFNILTAIMLIAIFSGSPVFSTKIAEDNDKAITGIIVRVDVKNHTIYIKENSRIVKFKAVADICERFKDKINSEVDVSYKIGNNKSLQIITIVLSEEERVTGEE